jgi:GAF domain-containing protein
MLTIEFPKVRSFNEREGRILTALIDQAGVAIDNRLLLQQTEQEVARNENLYAASRIINTAQTMQDLVYAAVATTNNVELDFGLSLLEGEIDGTGWSKQARIVARSQGGVITEDDFIYPLYLAEDSRLRNREPSVIIDENPKATDVSHFVQFVRQQGYRSMAIFPLFSANRPIALFHLMSYNVIELSDTDMEQYRALTGQMSSQIQIRRLLERTELALDETRRLYVASRAIAGAEEIADVYQAAVEHLARPFVHTQTGDEVDQKTYRISLLLAEPEATPDAPFYKYVYMWDSVGGAVQEFSDHARLTAEDFPYSQITRQSSGLAYFFDVQQASDDDDILKNSPILLDTLRMEKTQSLVVVPLRSRQKWFGVLLCQSNVTHAFEEQYLNFIQAMSDQIAIALENKSLFEEARFEAKRAQAEAQRALALAEAAQVANRIGDDFEQSLDDVFELVASSAGFDRWMLVLFDESGKRLVKAAIKTPAVDENADIFYDIAIPLPVVEAARNSQPILVNDLANYPTMRDFTDREKMYFVDFFGKHIAAPVHTGRQMLGSLFLGRSIDTDDLNERDMQLVTTLATQIGVALENRRLFDRVRSEQRTQRSILETLPAGVLVLDPETLLPIQFNRQVEIYLGQSIDPEKPFTVEAYNLFRTGTRLPYPEEEMPIFIALREGIQGSSDDVAVILEGDIQTDLLVDAAPIRDAQDNITAIVAAFQDISNLRSLENTLQENLRETVALYEAQRQLAEAEELDDVLDVIIVQLALLQPSDAYILMVDDISNTIQAARELVQPIEHPELLSDLLPNGGVSYIGDITRHDLSDEARTMLDSLGVQSMIAVPLRISERETPLGWMVVVSDAMNGFSDEQERVLSQLGDVTSTAIDNRYLIRRQNETVYEVQRLYEATNSLSQSRDIAQVTAVLQHNTHNPLFSIKLPWNIPHLISE